jgi:F-type H+-transporting ATPase subunit delta
MSSAEFEGAGPAAMPSIQEQSIGRVYAEALLNAADKRGTVDDVKAELHELVVETFRRQPEFEDFLSSGAISKDTKQKVIKDVLEGKVSELFFNTLMVLNEHYRLGLLRAVHLVFNQLYDQRHRRVPVRITTAVPLPDDQRDRLVSFFRDSLKLEPVLHTTVDPDILGGMMIRLGDWLLDRSVRTKLKAIEKELIARSTHEIQSRRDRFSHTAGD